jgi:hypothetical protein
MTIAVPDAPGRPSAEVSMGAGSDLWSGFPLDPRDRAHASLRASDEDRERITAVLSGAFADGRLDRDELDERISGVAAARTLGELPPLVADLVPLKPPAPRPTRSLVPLTTTEIEARAEQDWRARRRAAAFTFLSSALVCWTIWFAVRAGTGSGDFPWPLLVNVVTFLRLARLVASHEEIVRDEVRRLEKKQARQQRWPKGLA